MKNPPRRDRMACFDTVWPPSERDLSIASITVKYNCLNGDAMFVGVGNLRHPLNDKLREEIAPKLVQVGVRIDAMRATVYMFKLSPLQATKLKFRNHQEVISFINSIARALDYPPSYALKLSVEREVFTNFQSTKRRWMDEGELVLKSTPLT